MKKIFRSSILAAGFLTLVMAASAAAQTSYTANIPFDFTVEKKSYKAGSYSLGLLYNFTDSRKIVLRDTDGRNAYLFIPNANTGRVDRATLVFANTAEGYRLTAISTPAFRVDFTKSNRKYVLAGNMSNETETIAMTAGK